MRPEWWQSALRRASPITMVTQSFSSLHHQTSGQYLDFDRVTSALACQQHCRNHVSLGDMILWL